MTSPTPQRMPGEYIAGEMMPGTVYRVLGDIGKGGMGRVYEVVDTTIDAHYAAKVLLPSALIRHDLVERMRAEARVLGRLRSKYIVRVFTAGVTQDGAPYFVMDVLRGKPLQKVIRMHRGKKLPLDTARNLMVGVFLGLERAHEQGVVHRDIKPENILVVMDQENPTGPTYPVIVDFGIMSLLNEQTRITGGKQFLGTPGQASPEQCKGDRAAPPNDIYAAGLMLYQLVAGRHPFAEEIKSGNLRDIFGAHLYKTPRPPTDFEPSIDSALEHFIMRCLEKNPAARPTATDCVKELNRLIRLSDAETDERNTTQDMLVGEVHDAVEQTRVEQEIALGIADEQRAGRARVVAARNDATDPHFDEPPVHGAQPEAVPDVARAANEENVRRPGPSGTIRMVLPAGGPAAAPPAAIDRLALTQTSPVALPAKQQGEVTDPLFDSVPPPSRAVVEHIIAAMPRGRAVVDEYDTTMKSEEDPFPPKRVVRVRAYRGLISGVAIGTAIAALTIAVVTLVDARKARKVSAPPTTSASISVTASPRGDLPSASVSTPIVEAIAPSSTVPITTAVVAAASAQPVSMPSAIVAATSHTDAPRVSTKPPPQARATASAKNSDGFAPTRLPGSGL